MLSQRVRLSTIHFDVEGAEPLTETVLQVAWRFAERDQGNIQRDVRRSQRVSGQREVVALPLDEWYRVAGPAVNGVVANLSRHGQLLVTTTEITSPAVITQFQSARQTIQIVGRVVWGQYLDLGCFGAGTDFAARFGRSTI
jgi:hypothetical protein